MWSKTLVCTLSTFNYDRSEYSTVLYRTLRTSRLLAVGICSLMQTYGKGASAASETRVKLRWCSCLCLPIAFANVFSNVSYVSPDSLIRNLRIVRSQPSQAKHIFRRMGLRISPVVYEYHGISRSQLISCGACWRSDSGFKLLYESTVHRLDMRELVSLDNGSPFENKSAYSKSLGTLHATKSTPVSKNLYPYLSSTAPAIWSGLDKVLTRQMFGTVPLAS